MARYVIHCEKCKRVIEESKRYTDPCPSWTEKKVEYNPAYDGSYERKRFPYYDIALDMKIESKQQKRSVLKERGLEQIDGHFSNRKGKKDTKYFI